MTMTVVKSTVGIILVYMKDMDEILTDLTAFSVAKLGEIETNTLQGFV
jgi:hypothetical protein